MRKNFLNTEPGTQAVGRALEILCSFSVEKPRWKLKELASCLNLPKSSTYRILSALCNYGFLEENKDTKQYRLGLKIYELIEAVEIRQLFSRLVHPFLVELSEETGEICHVAIKNGMEFIYVDRMEGKYRFGLRTHIGMRLPLHIGGLGKVLLAYCDTKELELVLNHAKFERFTQNTITNSKRMREVLNQVRIIGYAIDEEEYEDGLTCVAVPIFDQNNDLVAAVSVSGPTGRLTSQKMPTYIMKTLKAGENISRTLAYEGDYPKKG